MAISQARTSPTTSAGIQPPRDTGTSRRALLGGGFALAGSWLLTGCVPAASDPAIPGGSRWPRGSLTDQPIVQKTLRAAPSIIDLGGTLAEAWAYNDTLPGIDLPSASCATTCIGMSRCKAPPLRCGWWPPGWR